MTWLGYEVIITNDQKLFALFFTLGMMVFGRVCGSALWKCLIAGLVTYPICIGYIINENAMSQIKAEFCGKHPELERCHPYLNGGWD